MKQRVKHQSEKGEPVQTCEGGRESFVVSDQATKASGPGKGALDDPSSGQQDKASFGLVEFYHDELNSLFGRLRGRFLSSVTLLNKKRLERSLPSPLAPPPTSRPRARALARSPA
jgi:hypothetical protein